MSVVSGGGGGGGCRRRERHSLFGPIGSPVPGQSEQRGQRNDDDDLVQWTTTTSSRHYLLHAVEKDTTVTVRFLGFFKKKIITMTSLNRCVD